MMKWIFTLVFSLVATGCALSDTRTSTSVGETRCETCDPGDDSTLPPVLQGAPVLSPLVQPAAQVADALAAYTNMDRLRFLCGGSLASNYISCCIETEGTPGHAPWVCCGLGLGPNVFGVPLGLTCGTSDTTI